MRIACAAVVAAALAGCGERAKEARNMTRNEIATEQAQVRINPGEWELTSRITGVEGPDLPREMMTAMQGRRTALRNCITPEQAADPAAFTRAGQQQGSSCQVRDFTMRDGRLQGATICGGGTPQEVRSEMSGTYGPDSFDYQSRVATPAPMVGGTMTLTVAVQGRRIGACSDPVEGNEG